VPRVTGQHNIPYNARVIYFTMHPHTYPSMCSGVMDPAVAALPQITLRQALLHSLQEPGHHRVLARITGCATHGWAPQFVRVRARLLAGVCPIACFLLLACVLAFRSGFLKSSTRSGYQCGCGASTIQPSAL
jgi:hypothetical protein